MEDVGIGVMPKRRLPIFLKTGGIPLAAAPPIRRILKKGKNTLNFPSFSCIINLTGEIPWFLFKTYISKRRKK